VHQAVAVDERGRGLAGWRGPNTPEAWAQLRAWADGLDGGPRLWGIEGAHTYGHGLAQFLVSAGEVVHDVNPRLTAGERRHARRRGKTDRLDAEAVACVLLREAARLPRVALEDEAAVLELLVREREDLRRETTRVRNQLHALLLRTEPGYETRLRPALRRSTSVARLGQYVARDDGPIARAREAAVRPLATRLRLLLEQSEALADQIRALAAPRYTSIGRVARRRPAHGRCPGCYSWGPRSFPTDAALAAYAGVVPLETSSAERVRHRLNRGGDRQSNAVLHRIVITQLRVSPAAKTYVARRRAEGKTWREAVRALKRHIARAVWRLWQRCRPAPTPLPLAPLAS
jgi:transposase